MPSFCSDPLSESARNKQCNSQLIVLFKLSVNRSNLGEEIFGETAWLIYPDISSFEMLSLLDGTSLALM